MKKVCMSYQEFMTKFKNADKTYAKKANVANKDAKTDSKINSELADDAVKGKGTAVISKITKNHLSNIKSKTSVIKAGKKS